MKMFEITSHNTWNKRGVVTNFKYYMQAKSVEKVIAHYISKNIKSIREL
jgi:hypothetical protein